jgi:hypothetical protein
LAHGHDVLWVDNHFTGRRDNIAHLLGEPHFEPMRHDITIPGFEAFFASEGLGHGDNSQRTEDVAGLQLPYTIPYLRLDVRLPP